MTDSNPHPSIQLSDESIEEVVSLCETVRRKTPKNETSVSIAQGIADYAQINGLVSYRQAVWLCRSADHWKIPRPHELAEVKIDRASPNSPIATIQPAPDFVERLNERLGRIEKLLAERL